MGNRKSRRADIIYIYIDIHIYIYICLRCVMRGVFGQVPGTGGLRRSRRGKLGALGEASEARCACRISEIVCLCIHRGLYALIIGGLVVHLGCYALHVLLRVHLYFSNALEFFLMGLRCGKCIS